LGREISRASLGLRNKTEKEEGGTSNHWARRKGGVGGEILLRLKTKDLKPGE